MAEDATASSLDEAPPGPRLAALLTGLEPADLGDDVLVEGIAAWERVNRLSPKRRRKWFTRALDRLARPSRGVNGP